MNHTGGGPRGVLVTPLLARQPSCPIRTCPAPMILDEVEDLRSAATMPEPRCEYTAGSAFRCGGNRSFRMDSASDPSKNSGAARPEVENDLFVCVNL